MYLNYLVNEIFIIFTVQRLRLQTTQKRRRLLNFTQKYKNKLILKFNSYILIFVILMLKMVNYK